MSFALKKNHAVICEFIAIILFETPKNNTNFRNTCFLGYGIVILRMYLHLNNTFLQL